MPGPHAKLFQNRWFGLEENPGQANRICEILIWIHDTCISKGKTIHDYKKG